MVRAHALGFTSGSFLFYQLRDRDPSRYVREFFDVGFRSQEPARGTLRDKFLYGQVMRVLGVRCPDLVAYVEAGWDYGSSAGVRRRPLAELLGDQEVGSRWVLRPVSGFGGSALFLDRCADDRYRLGGRELDRAGALAHLADRDHYVVTRWLASATYIREVYPEASSTVRALTLWDLERGEPFVASTAHRIGTRDSAPLDGFKRGYRGALSAAIDRETGALGPGWGLADDGSIQWHRVHPETGVAIEGLQVPRWQDLLSTALRAARAFPQMPFIGWDVLVTEEGPALLEANTLPALPVWQVHEPLLDDPRSRAFFEHYRLA